MSRGTALIASVLLGGLAATAAAQHVHPPQAAATAPAKSAPAKPAPVAGWATDAPLRAGMGRIAHAVDTLGNGKPGPEQARTLVASIETDVTYLVTHCRLEPAADAALHGIIAKLLQGAAALKRQPADPAAMALLQDAVRDYARTFDDPAFRPKPARTSPAPH